MTKINSTIEGIVYENVDFIDPDLQPWCPLEHTGLEAECKNEFNNIQLRSEGPCSHSAECFVLRAQHNASKLG
jgi:hypothetical protein